MGRPAARSGRTALAARGGGGVGESLTVGGVHLKVGTCESAYYVRRDEAEAWRRGEAGNVERAPHSMSLDDWLEGEVFWRFPVPWEDDGARDVRRISERSAFPDLPVISLGRIPGRHRKGCRYPKAFEGGSSPLPGSGLLARVMADHWHPKSEHNWTVFECFWCQERFAVGRGHVVWWRIEGESTPGVVGEIKRRLMPAPPLYPSSRLGAL